MNKKLAASISLALSAALSPYADAAGLGDVNMHSALYQPLDAEIRIRNIGDLGASQVLVNLGSHEDFERAGVDRVFFLTGIKFEVELLGNGEGIIHLRTERAVKEPYLDFLIELRWPTGRVLREYTVLLDLPLYSDEVAAAPTPSQPDRDPSGSRREATRPATVTMQAGESYLVVRGDTLWSIASRLRQGDATIQQTMMSLHRNNPDAFVDGNINRLRAGQLLQIPSSGDFESISPREAMREVRDQNRAWRQGDEPAPAVAAPAAAEPADDSSYLRIAGGEQDAEGTAGEGYGGSGGEAGGELQQDLIAAEEEREVLARENEELRSRLEQMEEQVDTAERLVDLKDSEMAALQDVAGQSDAAPAPAEVDYNYAEETEQQVAESAPAPAPAPGPEPGLIDKILANTVALGAGLAALVALVVVLLFRRRKTAYEDIPPMRPGPRAAEARPEPEPEREEPEAPAPIDEETTELEAAPEEVATAAPEEVHAETEDAIAEAEIYLAYGRSDAAVELLSRALEEEPQRSDVRLKLMDICADNGDEHVFVAHFNYFVETGDTEAAAAARAMLAGSSVADWLEPDDAAAKGAIESEPAVGDLELSPDYDDELEDEADEESALDLEDASGELELDTEIDLEADLDLGSELDDALGGTEIAAEPVAAEAVGELDLGAELDAALDTEESAAELDLDDELDAALDTEVSTGELDLEGDLDSELDAAYDEAEETADLDLDAALDAELGAGDAEIVAPAEAESPVGQGAEADEDLGLLDETDEVATKLDLARAYVDMGDIDGAREILSEVISDGDEQQQAQAREILEGLN